MRLGVNTFIWRSPFRTDRDLDLDQDTIAHEGLAFLRGLLG